MRPVLVGCAGHGVTAQHHAAAVSSNEVSDSATGEVPADSMEHYPGQHLCLLLPDCDYRVVSLEPLPVSRLHIDGHATEPVRPFDLHAEHVWMAGRDRRHASQLLNRANQVLVDVSVGIPQQVARRCLDQQCTLTDPDRRFDRDAIQTALDFGNCSPVPGSGQLLQGDPLLAGRPHILTLITANRTDRGWFIGVGLLHGAGTTD
jgi:hypothetical protein